MNRAGLELESTDLVYLAICNLWRSAKYTTLENVAVEL